MHVSLFADFDDEKAYMFHTWKTKPPVSDLLQEYMDTFEDRTRNNAFILTIHGLQLPIRNQLVLPRNLGPQ